MSHLRCVLVLAVALAGSAGCLVVSVNPSYDDTSISWDPDLVGAWENKDDRASLEIERGEWKSYRIHYVHAIETGDLTGYLTTIGKERYLDVMPARGEDHGSFLVPVHVVLRVQRQGDHLELTPLSYDWFFDRLRAGRAVPGLRVTRDREDNALILSPVGGLRAWLRAQPSDGPMFGAAAVFTRR
jgi:hypothetical protein